MQKPVLWEEKLIRWGIFKYYKNGIVSVTCIKVRSSHNDIPLYINQLAFKLNHKTLQKKRI